MLNILFKSLTIAVLASLSMIAVSEETAITPEGKKVILNDDGTWQFKDEFEQNGSQEMLLTLERMKSLETKCKFGFRLTNNLDEEVKTIVPVFSAYIDENVLFDSKSTDYFSIRPTKSAYREISFFGIQCDKIKYVKVSGADRCSIGSRDKYTSQDGECLGMIHVAESDLIGIVKE